MSSSHEDHYLQEQKPIAFTIPFILASVLIVIIFLFVSLCDPKPHHGHTAEHHGAMPMESSVHSSAAAESQEASQEPAKMESSASEQTQEHH